MAEAEWAARVADWFPQLTDTSLRQVTWTEIGRHHDYIAGQLREGDYDTTDDLRRIGARAHTAGQAVAAEQASLKPLPIEPFETGRWFTPRVDRYAQITVRSNRDSVPSRLIGGAVRALLNASDLTVYGARAIVASYERLLGQGGPGSTSTSPDGTGSPRPGLRQAVASR